MKLYTVTMTIYAIAFWIVTLLAVVFAAEHHTWSGLAMLGLAFLAFGGCFTTLILLDTEHRRKEP